MNCAVGFLEEAVIGGSMINNSMKSFKHQLLAAIVGGLIGAVITAGIAIISGYGNYKDTVATLRQQMNDRVEYEHELETKIESISKRLHGFELVYVKQHPDMPYNVLSQISFVPKLNGPQYSAAVQVTANSPNASINELNQKLVKNGLTLEQSNEFLKAYTLAFKEIGNGNDHKKPVTKHPTLPKEK